MNAERGTTLPVALQRDGAVRYRLRQSFVYHYDRPVRNLEHRLVVVPPAVHGDQRLCAGTVSVSDAAASVRWRADAFGNRHCIVDLAEVPPRLELHVSVVVERGPIALLRLRPRPPAVGPARFRRPSPLTAADGRIEELAHRHAIRGDVLGTADAFCAVVPELIRYGFGVTDVQTTAAEALTLGTGVCQDQAHLMLAMCRSVGIAAQYVSGHLVGQGGTHAWTEVHLPGRSAVVAFDPCHGRRADQRYVTVAVGRDYRDVPPTSGRYEGSGCGQLTTSRLLESELLAA